MYNLKWMNAVYFIHSFIHSFIQFYLWWFFFDFFIYFMFILFVLFVLFVLFMFVLLYFFCLFPPSVGDGLFIKTLSKLTIYAINPKWNWIIGVLVSILFVPPSSYNSTASITLSLISSEVVPPKIRTSDGFLSSGIMIYDPSGKSDWKSG